MSKTETTKPSTGYVGDFSSLFGDVDTSSEATENKVDEAKELNLDSIGKSSQSEGLASLVEENEVEEQVMTIELPEVDNDDNDEKENEESPQPSTIDNSEITSIVDSEDDDKRGVAEVYKDAYRTLAEKNKWDDIEIEIEGQTYSIDEVELDKELFEELVAQQIEDSRQKLLENKISTDGVSDFTKKLIEIEKNGGDVSAALNLYEKVGNPLERADLSKPEDQEAIVYLRLQQTKMPEEEIIEIIDGYKKSDVLEAKAIKYKEELDTAYTGYLDSLEQKAKDDLKQREENLKVYRKKLSEELKTFQFNDSYSRKIVDLATKENEDKTFELDNMYKEIRKDPKRIAEIALFIADPSEFKKHIIAEAKKENLFADLEKRKIIRKKGGGTSPVREQRKEAGDLTPLDKLI